MKERLRKDDRNCLLLFILRFLSASLKSVTGEAGDEKASHNSLLTLPVTFYWINHDSVTGSSCSHKCAIPAGDQE